ncbi:CBS domain protein [compost metagenome]
MTQYKTIDVNDTLETAVALLLDSQNKSFVVTENNKVVGTLNRDEIILALSKKEDNPAIHTFMNKNLIYLDIDSLLENAFEQVYQNKLTLVLVTEKDQVIGTLDTENILEFILIKEVKTKKNYASN